MKRLYGYIAGAFAFLITAILILMGRNRKLENKVAQVSDEKDLAVATERKERATLNFGEAYAKYRKERDAYRASKRNDPK